MSAARFIIGDTRDVVATLPDGSVDLVLTSPPFLALRSYLPADHPDKHREIGSEATPADFLDVLLGLAAEWRRVLAPHGSIAVELGDTYSGQNESGWERGEREGRAPGAAYRQGGMPKVGGRSVSGWPLDKSLTGIPHLFHLSLAYGRNLLTGQPSPAGQWRVRNVICWARPNPPVGALGDKMRPATSYMTIATIARDRYFDLDAVRQPYSELTMKVKGEEWAAGARGFRTGPKAASGETGRPMAESRATHAGAPPLDWWEPLPEEQALWDQWADELWQIPTAPYKGSHYATWPPALCVRPIKAMVPEKVCRVCGEPSRRISEVTDEYAAQMGDRLRDPNTNGRVTSQARNKTGDITHARRAETVGWTDCGHNDWRPGLVLDPFAGSGTTLQVATGHGRDAIGIDIDARNADLARERVGMFLDVEHHTVEEGVA